MNIQRFFKRFIKGRDPLKEVISVCVEDKYDNLQPLEQVGLAMMLLYYFYELEDKEAEGMSILQILEREEIDTSELSKANMILTENRIIRDNKLTFKDPTSPVEYCLACLLLKGHVRYTFKDEGNEPSINLTEEGLKSVTSIMSR